MMNATQRRNIPGLAAAGSLVGIEAARSPVAEGLVGSILGSTW